MRKTISCIIGLILIAAMCSCSASWHLNQAIKKGAQVKTDTVRVETETIIPKVEKDTVFIEPEIGDTVVIEKEKLKIKYVRLPGDTIYITGECEADTVISVVEIPCDQTITPPANAFNFRSAVIGASVLSIILMLFFLKRKFF